MKNGMWPGESEDNKLWAETAIERISAHHVDNLKQMLREAFWNGYYRGRKNLTEESKAIIQAFENKQEQTNEN